MNSVNRPSWTAIVLAFLYMWLMIGFFLGTLVLIGPVRWLTSAVRQSGAGQSLENPLVIALVVVYVLFSAWLAFRTSRAAWISTNPMTRFGLPVIATLLAGSAAFAWSNPGRMLSAVAGGGGIENVNMATGAVFEFGPYPDEKLLRELKGRGVTTVISLQHPDVPVERPGIAEEERNVKDLGITLVHAPMLPWFSDNKAALDTIRALVARGKGRYYVHCGLGRDRVNTVRKLIEGLGAKAVSAKGYAEGLGFEYRTAPMGRGPVVRLAPGVWMVPFPDNFELYGCFLQGSPGRVLIAMDVADTTEQRLFQEAKRVLDPVAFRYDVIEVDYSKRESVRRLADSLANTPPPVTLVVRATRGIGENGVQNEGWEGSVAVKNAFLSAPSDLPVKGAAGRARPAKYSYRPPVEMRGAEDTRPGC